MSQALVAKMMAEDFATVRSAFIACAMSENDRRDGLRAALTRAGFVATDEQPALTGPDGQMFFADGRIAIQTDVGIWAITQEQQAEMVRAGLEAQRSTEPTAVSASAESLGPLCPKCGEPTNQTTVCPKCTMGKAGLKYQYACTCGVTFFTKEALS